MTTMTAAAFGIVAMLTGAFCSAVPAGAAQPHWPAPLVIGTASPGGTYAVYGEGLARILTRDLGTPVNTRSTEGPSQNIMLLENGEVHIGFVTTGAALQAWNGTGPWTGGKEFRSMSVMFPMYDTPFQFMAFEEANVRTIADLAGKRIGAGPQAGTAGTYVPEILKTLKVEATISHGDWAELADRMQRREIDALAVAAGVPFPSFAELEARNKVRYIPLTPDQIVALRLAMPELTPSVVPAGSYPSLRGNYQTVGLYNFAVAHRDLPIDLVYQIVRTVFTRHEELVEVHPAAAATVPGNFGRNTFLPFHPGAARYFEEIGAAGIVLAD
ncbi:MAG TPA: TAXI family TRAP transporter solute-binding subunit [Azospirillum sp.]|nr:TAXI family TRAP transporter solute-binding subunit [Azospirillum sp.]